MAASAALGQRFGEVYPGSTWKDLHPEKPLYISTLTLSHQRTSSCMSKRFKLSSSKISLKYVELADLTEPLRELPPCYSAAYSFRSSFVTKFRFDRWQSAL